MILQFCIFENSEFLLTVTYHVTLLSKILGIINKKLMMNFEKIWCQVLISVLKDEVTQVARLSILSKKGIHTLPKCCYKKRGKIALIFIC